MLKASLKGWVLAGLCSAMFPTSSVQGQTPRLRVAVYPFGQAAVEANIEKETGMKVNYGDIAAQLLVGELTSQVDVINRDQMERILAEQGRKYDERFDPSKAPEFGKLLGVDAIVTGNIIALSAEQKTGSGIGGKASAIGGIIKGKMPKVNTDSTNIEVKVQITAAMISTVTGNTLGSHTGQGNVNKQIAGKVQINDKGSNDTSASKSGYDPSIREALQGAVKELGAQFAPAYVSAPRAAPVKSTEVSSSKAPAPTEPKAEPKTEPEYQALTDEVGNVYKVDGGVVTFLIAPGAKVAKGDLLEVQEVEMAKNPRSGKLVAVGSTMGTLKVTEISGETGKGAYQGKPASDKYRLVKKQASAAAPGRPPAKPIPAKP